MTGAARPCAPDSCDPRRDSVIDAPEPVQQCSACDRVRVNEKSSLSKRGCQRRVEIPLSPHASLTSCWAPLPVSTAKHRSAKVPHTILILLGCLPGFGPSVQETENSTLLKQLWDGLYRLSFNLLHIFYLVYNY